MTKVNTHVSKVSKLSALKFVGAISQMLLTSFWPNSKPRLIILKTFVLFINSYNSTVSQSVSKFVPKSNFCILPFSLPVYASLSYSATCHPPYVSALPLSVQNPTQCEFFHMAIFTVSHPILKLKKQSVST